MNNEDNKPINDDEPKQANPNGSQPPSSTPPNGGGAAGGSQGGGGGIGFLHIILTIFLITFLINLLLPSSNLERARNIEYSQFLQLVDSGYVDHAQLSDNEVLINLKDDADMAEVEQIIYPEGREENEIAPTTDEVLVTVRIAEDTTLIERLDDNGVKFTKTYVKTQSSPIMSFITSFIIPMVIFYFIYAFFIKRMMNRMGQGGGGAGGMFNTGKSKAKEYNVEKSTGVAFDDVAGQDEAKESLTEMVDYLHNPERYKSIGAKQPKGALLVGPPGTGKTMLAKALAGEAKVPFYSISGSEFVEMFVGVGASRVRDMFDTAKKNAPCIIFIDEIDAIGKSRDNQLSQNDEREQTLNQLLTEMDGFGSEEGIIVLAATNRPEVLDKALLRPGRFDRRIIVEKPDLPGREAILKVHSDKVKLGTDVNLHEIALATSGATGADLANMVNEGALLAVKDGRETVAQRDLMEAVEVVIAGKEKKDRIMNTKERRMVAYHEVGHALVSALQKNSQPVQKITIVPRTMGSLGYTMNMPEEERYLMTRSELLAQITTLLGGRAAELVTFGEMTTGASNDIERATDLARSMVTKYGMSDKFGPVGLESSTSQYLDGRNVSNCSPDTEAKIDAEVQSILSGCQADAVSLLKNNGEALNSISEYLLDKENITGEEFMQLLNQNRNIA